MTETSSLLETAEAMGLIGSEPVAEKQETQLFWDTPPPALPKVKASPNNLLADPGGLTHQPPLSILG